MSTACSADPCSRLQYNNFKKNNSVKQINRPVCFQQYRKSDLLTNFKTAIVFLQDQGNSRDTETEQCSNFIKKYSYTFSFLCLFLYLLATNSLLSFPGYLNYLTCCFLCILLLAWRPSFLPFLLVPLVPDTLRIAIWLCY